MDVPSGIRAICDFQHLLHKNIAHCFDELVAVISGVFCHVPTANRVVRMSLQTKPDLGVTGFAIGLVVTEDANSCFDVSRDIEAFFTAASLQRSLRANQRLPRVTALCCGAVLPVSDQGVQ